MNIIFLDIDGVLNSAAYFNSIIDNKSKYYEINEYNLKILSTIYHNNNAIIVLSSTWRNLIGKHKNTESINMYNYLLNSLNKYNMKILDHTPYIKGNRPLEILTYLQKTNENINFISIDDDFTKKQYDYYGIGNHLIRTIYYTDNLLDGGLQPKHIQEADNKFQINYKERKLKYEK